MNEDVATLGDPSPVGLRDRVLLLRSLEILRGLDDDALHLLAEHARNRVYGRGKVLSREGGQPKSFHIVVDGRVTVTRRGRASIVDAGHTVGLLAITAGAPTGLAIAQEVTRTLEIPTAAFLAALDENFSLVRDLLRLMGSTLSKAHGALPADPSNPPPAEMGTYFEAPRTLVELLLYLRGSPFGTSTPIAALVALARRMVDCRVPAGHLFWSAGEPAVDSITILYGRVRCTSPDGQSVEVGANFSLGVLDVSGSQPRSYEARALTDVIAYRVRFEDFLTILEVHSLLGTSLLTSFAASILESAESM